MNLAAGNYLIEITAVATTGQTLTYSETMSVSSDGIVPIGLINHATIINSVLPVGNVIVNLNGISHESTLENVIPFIDQAPSVSVDIGLINSAVSINNVVPFVPAAPTVTVNLGRISNTTTINNVIPFVYTPTDVIYNLGLITHTNIIRDITYNGSFINLSVEGVRSIRDISPTHGIVDQTQNYKIFKI